MQKEGGRWGEGALEWVGARLASGDRARNPCGRIGLKADLIARMGGA
jgi:hypothetical protein